MSEFTPEYPRDEDTNEEVSIGFTRAEFYDVIYAAREAEIRFKRLRTKTREESSSHLTEEEANRNQYVIEECNEKIAHYKSMETWLKNKYRDAYGEYW